MQGVVPARQGLKAHQRPTRLETHDRLQVAGDLSIRDGEMKIGLQAGPALGRQAHAQVVEAEPPPALLLGSIHRHVGVLDQPFGGLTGRSGGDPQRGAAEQGPALHHQRLHQAGDQALRELLHRHRIAVRHHHHELISPQASHQMVGLCQLLQPGGQGDQ